MNTAFLKPKRFKQLCSVKRAVGFDVTVIIVNPFKILIETVCT